MTFMTVLHESRPIARGRRAARRSTEDEARAALERAKKRLFEVREKRPKPFRDEKILTSWSALMIGAMAEAGAALREPTLHRRRPSARFAFVEEKLVTWTRRRHERARAAPREGRRRRRGRASSTTTRTSRTPRSISTR